MQVAGARMSAGTAASAVLSSACSRSLDAFVLHAACAVLSSLLCKQPVAEHREYGLEQSTFSLGLFGP